MRIKFWLDNARYVSLPQSLLPCLLATAMVSNSEQFNGWLAALAILGACLAHFGMNLCDDYFDYLKDKGNVRQQLADKGMRSRIAKCSYLTSGQATVNQLRNAIAVFFLLALVCGSVVWYFRGMWIVYIALAAGFLGISYSGWPLRLGYYGLGELLIGVMFGPMLMAGVAVSAGGFEAYGPAVIWVSIAVGLFVMNIVYSHAIMDAQPDKEIGKMTFARLFSPIGQLIVSAICNFVPFIIITIAAVLQVVSYWYLLVWLLFPMAVYLFYSLVCFVKNKAVNTTPQWWMGPMERWGEIKQHGIDWFMIRWYLCRNLVTFFCIILTIINFCI